MRARDHESEIRERAKESQREFKGEKIRTGLSVASTASLLSSPLSYVILAQKPRDRISGRSNMRIILLVY